MAKQKAKPGSAAELAELYPAPRVVPVKVRTGPDAPFEDATVAVEEMDITQVGHAAVALAGIPNLLSQHPLVIVAEYRDEVMAALGIAIHWPAERVALLSADSAWRLLETVGAMNDGFFTRLLGLAVYGTTMVPKARGAGPMRSNTSVSADTENQSATH